MGSWTVNLKFLIYALYFVLLLPDFLQKMGVIHYAVLLFKGLAGCIAIYMLLLMKNRSKALNCLILYVLYMGAVTIINAFEINNIARYIAKYGAVLIFSVFTEYLLIHDSVKFIKFLRYVLGFGFIINIISVFVFPNGLTYEMTETGRLMEVFFYDYDNHFMVRYIPTIAVIYVYEKHVSGKNKGGIETLLIIIFSFISLLLRHSIASLISCTIIIFGYFLLNMIPEKVLSSKFAWIGYLLMSFFLVISGVILLGTSLITGLGKSGSLIVRMRMWALAVIAILNHLVFGTGVLDSFIMRNSFYYAQLHNSMLTILLWGGIVGFVLYSRFIFSLNIKSSNKELIEDKRLLFVLLIATMTVSLLDGVELLMNIYLFYILIANYDRFIENLHKMKSLNYLCY